MGLGNKTKKVKRGNKENTHSRKGKATFSGGEKPTGKKLRRGFVGRKKKKRKVLTT